MALRRRRAGKQKKRRGRNVRVGLCGPRRKGQARSSVIAWISRSKLSSQKCVAVGSIAAGPGRPRRERQALSRPHTSTDVPWERATVSKTSNSKEQNSQQGPGRGLFNPCRLWCRIVAWACVTHAIRPSGAPTFYPIGRVCEPCFFTTLATGVSHSSMIHLDGSIAG